VTHEDALLIVNMVRDGAPFVFLLLAFYLGGYVAKKK
jgi:hypothetical protein